MSFQQYNIYDGLMSARVVASTNQSGTYYNGPLNNGVGATFTYGTGALTIDSVAVNVGDSVVLAGQSNGWENGVYVVMNAGATGVSAVLQRRNDMQCIEQLRAGQWLMVGAGTVHAGSLWVVVEPLPGIFGVDSLSFTSAISASAGTASTKNASDNTKSIVASVGSAVQVGYLPHFVDTSGTIDDTNGAVINGGTIQSGLSGVAGGFIGYPGTAGNGFLELLPVNAGGAFNTIISNGTMGQTSTYTLPDPGNAAARFLVGATATPFTSGNFPVASGTGGLMVDSGVPAANLQNKTNIKAAQSADIGGAGAGPLNIVNASVAATSVIVASIISSSNPCSIIAVTPGAGSFNVTVSADPGASLKISYVIFVAPQ